MINYMNKKQEIKIGINNISEEWFKARIDRKTLKAGIDQCAIIDPSVNTKKILKDIQHKFLDSSENKL